MAPRIGFLGAGLIATFHSKMLRASGVEHRRVGVYDPDTERAEGFVAAAGGHLAGSPDEVIEGADAVYVCTWTAAHEDLVRRAVDAGVAVFVEKPLAPDLDGARRVAQTLTDSGVVHQVGLILRWSPAYALARALVHDRDDVGRIMGVLFRDDQGLPVGGRYGSAWRADPDRAGAGVLLEHSIHDLDLLDHVVGPVTSVAAHRRFFHGIDGIEDLVVASLELADGGLASLTTVWHDNPARNSLRLLEVHCEKALVRVEGDWFGPVRIDRDGATIEWQGDDLLEECRARGLPVVNPDGEFVTAVRDGGVGAPSASIARRAHELCDAAYRSAESGGAPIAT